METEVSHNLLAVWKLETQESWLLSLKCRETGIRGPVKIHFAAQTVCQDGPNSCCLCLIALFRPFMDCMVATHMGEGKLLSKTGILLSLKCQFPPGNLTDIPRNNVEPNIWTPCDQSNCHIKWTITLYFHKEVLAGIQGVRQSILYNYSLVSMFFSSVFVWLPENYF